MAAEITEIEWPGLKSILGFDGSISHGITPGVFRITCAPQNAWPKTNGTLIFRYDTTGFRFEDCKIANANVRYNASGQIVGFNLVDRRWRWSGGYITGRYNTREPNGDLSEGTIKKNPRELAKLLLEAMGEVGYDEKDFPDEGYPSVSWDYANPARELAELCETYGYRVVLQLTGKVKLCKIGKGANLPVQPHEGFAEAMNLVQMPDSIMVVGAEMLCQVDFYLRPVGRTADTNPNEIHWARLFKVGGNNGEDAGELPYRPQEKWSDSPADDVNDAGVPKATLERLQLLADESVWKWYEAWSAKRNNQSKLLDELGVPADTKDIRDDKPSDGPHLFLPIVNAVDIETITGQESQELTFIPEVWGEYFVERDDGDDKKNNVERITNPTTYTLSSSDEYVHVPFSIRQTNRAALVIFNECVFKHKADASIERPTLYLRAFTKVLNPKTFQHIRYTHKRKLSDPKGVARPLVLFHDDIQLCHTFSEDLNKKNLAECEKRADYYIDAKLEELKSLKPQTANYVGWYRIDLDGAIQQLEWSMAIGSGGGTRMTVHRNHAPASKTTESYNAKRGYERAKEMEEARLREKQPAALSGGFM